MAASLHKAEDTHWLANARAKAQRPGPSQVSRRNRGSSLTTVMTSFEKCKVEMSAMEERKRLEWILAGEWRNPDNDKMDAPATPIRRRFI